MYAPATRRPCWSVAMVITRCAQVTSSTLTSSSQGKVRSVISGLVAVAAEGGLFRPGQGATSSRLRCAWHPVDERCCSLPDRHHSSPFHPMIFIIIHSGKPSNVCPTPSRGWAEADLQGGRHGGSVVAESVGGEEPVGTAACTVACGHGRVRLCRSRAITGSGVHAG